MLKKIRNNIFAQFERVCAFFALLLNFSKGNT